MKRTLVLAMIACLVAGSVTTAEARKAKPVKTTFYLHGTETVGEVDLASNFGVAYNKLDTTEPDGAAPKSITPPAWSGPPWNDCAGSYILPVWSGSLVGRVVGDMKVTLHVAAAPRPITVQIWPDLMTQTCASNDVSQGQYPEPAAQATVTVPPGASAVEFVLEDLNFKALGALTMQIRPEGGPFPGRILYDAADFASSIEFSCIPAKGKSCV